MFRLLDKKVSQEQIDQEIATVLNWVLSHVQPLKIYVFGSAVTGEFTTGSDIDIALIFSTVEAIKLGRKRLNMGPRPLERSLDILYFEENHFLERVTTGSVCYEIKNYGKLLYSAGEIR